MNETKNNSTPGSANHRTSIARAINSNDKMLVKSRQHSIINKDDDDDDDDDDDENCDDDDDDDELELPFDLDLSPLTSGSPLKDNFTFLYNLCWVLMTTCWCHFK